ncbi:MAG: hypothetical protein L0G94_12510 [Brachybacterium sp.]|uniref:hypothetical protein n=1 Tax=Brachybacterium sp. TaxID=1891286 RepID=UPI00264A200D|nr:hypothetical protein [Brachybacterium sp.]MDN5687475.1 hypothetical protein [Brachybacterium sp.]
MTEFTGVAFVDRLSLERLVGQRLRALRRHPVVQVLQRAPDSGRRDALVARHVLIGHVVARLEVDPLGKLPAHPSTDRDPDAARVDLPRSQEIEHGLAVQKGCQKRTISSTHLPSPGEADTEDRS